MTATDRAAVHEAARRTGWQEATGAKTWTPKQLRF
jgi:hypothetical protein